MFGIFSIISMIFQILMQLPTIIKIIRQIIDLIRGLPRDEQKEARERLRSVLLNVKKKKTVSTGDVDELSKLLADLEARTGK